MTNSSSSATAAARQSLTPGPYVELYSLDTTPLTKRNGTLGTGQVFYWTPGMIGGQEITFNGNAYAPMPVKLSGLLTAGQGKPPTPTLDISAIGGIVVALTQQYGDLLGAQVTRIRTFEQYLDGQPQADPSAYIGPDIFYIDQKSHHDKESLQFKLSIIYDQLGRRFPARQVFRDACTRIYRYYDPTAGAFRYAPGTNACPYTGSAYYDAGGKSVSTPQQDVCGKRLSDCRLRFPGQALPTYAFPGVSYAAVSG